MGLREMVPWKGDMHQVWIAWGQSSAEPQSFPVKSKLRTVNCFLWILPHMHMGARWRCLEQSGYDSSSRSSFYHHHNPEWFTHIRCSSFTSRRKLQTNNTQPLQSAWKHLQTRVGMCACVKGCRTYPTRTLNENNHVDDKTGAFWLAPAVLSKTHIWQIVWF